MKKSKKSFVYIALKLLQISFMAAPIHYSIYIAFVIANGLSSAFLTLALQRFFDSIELGIKVGSVTAGMIEALVLVGVVIVGSHIINGVDNFLSDALGKKINGRYTLKMMQKSSLLDPVLFESHQFLDLLSKARSGMDNAYYFLSVSMVIFIYYTPYFLFMSIYLFMLKPSLVFTLLLVFIPTVLAQVVRSGFFSDMEEQVAPIKRSYQHYTETIGGTQYLKETRLFGIYGFLQQKLSHTIQLLQHVIWTNHSKAKRIDLITKILTLIGYGGVLAMLVVAVIKQDISIGAFAAVFASIATMFDTMNEAIGWHINNISKSLGSVRNFIDFLEYPTDEKGQNPVDYTQDLVVSNLSFQYPGAKTKALDSLNFTIKAGETIAIVGENGSGKTTLAKILVGLFDPTEGTITIGKEDLSQIDRATVLAGISAVFQKYQRYQMTLQENVYIGETTRTLQTSKVEDALNKSGVDASSSSFPDGLGTMLSKEFGGVELSGGQWQRLAIARAFYRKHQVILLDEPTAAVDPIEESHIYQRFSQLSAEKTTILITHRLGSIKLADRILLLEGGKVVESGSHTELMQQNRRYAQMYMAQSQWYE